MQHSPRFSVIPLSLILLGLRAPPRAQEPAASTPHTPSITIAAALAIDGIAQPHAERAGSGRMSLAAIVGGENADGT